MDKLSEKQQTAALRELLKIVGAKSEESINPDRLVLGERMWYLLRYTE